MSSRRDEKEGTVHKKARHLKMFLWMGILVTVSILVLAASLSLWNMATNSLATGGHLVR